MRWQICLGATLLVLCGLIAACGGNSGPVAEPTPTLDLLDSAAAEATALVQQARATAIVLKAKAQATALVEQALLGGGTPVAATPEPAIQASPAPAGEQAEATPSVQAGASPEVEEIPVQVTSVGFAAEGGMIVVRFLAPPEEAAKWWQGDVSVTDEGNGEVYDEVPVMPKIGPLIGRPKVAGQAGYIMLMNVPPYLQPGALVTVVLGAHEFEHVLVQ
jgi:hypothetical protein